MKNCRKLKLFARISTFGLHLSNPLACTQVIFWLSITLGKMFLFKIYHQKMTNRRKLTHFFRGFLYLASTSNSLAFNNTRTSGFFNLILDNTETLKIDTFFRGFLCLASTSNLLAFDNTWTKIFFKFNIRQRKIAEN